MHDKTVEDVAQQFLQALEGAAVPRGHRYRVSVRVCSLAHQQKLLANEATVAVFRSLIAVEESRISYPVYKLYSEFWAKVADAVEFKM